MQAKVRTQTGHPPSSPKVKRKRESTECANKQGSMTSSLSSVNCIDVKFKTAIHTKMRRKF